MADEVIEGGNDPQGTLATEGGEPNPNPNPDPNPDPDKSGDPDPKPNPDPADKDGDDKDKDGDDKDKDKDEDGAPEAYEDFQLPEDFKPDEARLTQFKDLAKELDLSQGAAQKLVDFQVAMEKMNADASRNYWENLSKEWQTKASEDKEIGGEKFEENLGLVHKAVEAFGTDGLKEVFDTTATGNHPEVLRFLYRVGKAMGDDNFHFGKGETAPKKSAADILYGKNEN